MRPSWASASYAADPAAGAGSVTGAFPARKESHQASSRAVREEGVPHPARAAVDGDRTAYAAQVPCCGEVVEGGADGALAVREVFGQRLDGDVGLVVEPVQVRRDRGLASGQMDEVPSGTGLLVGRRFLSVPRIGHGVSGGARGSTKLGGSHGSSRFRSGWSDPRVVLQHPRGSLLSAKATRSQHYVATRSQKVISPGTSGPWDRYTRP